MALSRLSNLELIVQRTAESLTFYLFFSTRRSGPVSQSPSSLQPAVATAASAAPTTASAAPTTASAAVDLERRLAELMEEKECREAELAGQRAKAAHLELNLVQMREDADAKVRNNEIAAWIRICRYLIYRSGSSKRD